MSKPWQKKAANDIKQGRLSTFLTPGFKRTATTSSDKENTATPQSSGEVRDDSDRITVKRHASRTGSQSRSRTNTPDVGNVSKARTGTTAGTSLAKRAATPDGSKSVKIKTKEVSQSPRKSSRLSTVEEQNVAGEREHPYTPREVTTKAATLIPVIHTIKVAPPTSTSRPRASSVASFVTASDGLSSPLSSPAPNTEPTTVSQVPSGKNLQSLDQSRLQTEERSAMGTSASKEDSLKRTHSVEASGCPRIDEQKPNKRMRGKPTSPEELKGTQSAPLSIGSSPPIITHTESVKPVFRQLSPWPMQTAPSSSFLLPPPYQSSSISLLSKTPTPPISVSLQRFESLKSSFPPYIVIPSSESDENAEPLEVEMQDINDQQSDDEDELTIGASSSTPIAAPASLKEKLEREDSPLSDLHSEASDYDSDASLGDLSDLIPGLRAVKKKHQPQSLDGAMSSPSDDDLVNPLGGSKGRGKNGNATKISADDNQRVTRSADGSLKATRYFKKIKATIVIPTPQYRFSLKDLVKYNKLDQSARAEIARAQEVLNREDDNKGSESDRDELYGNDQNGLLSTVVNQEEGGDNVGKLLMVISRANAAKTRTTFHFNVDGVAADSPLPEFPDTPADQAWSLMKDKAIREEAFATGFARQILRSCTLDDQKRKWMLEMAMREPQAHLADSYLDALIDVVNHHDTETDRLWMESANRALGSATVSTGETIRAIEHPVVSSPRIPSAHLLQTVRIIDRLNVTMPPHTRIVSLMTLAQLGIDNELMQDVELRHTHHRAFASILSRLDDQANIPSEDPQDDFTDPATAILKNGNNVLRSLCLSLYNKLDNTTLQDHLISNLPCATSRTHDFRRRLALAYFLHSNLPCRQETDSLNSNWALQVLPTTIVTELETDSTLHITETTDFSILTARIQLLDAAIDCGFSPTFPLPQAAPPHSTPADTVDLTNLFPDKAPSTSTNTPDIKTARQAHNAAIDLLLRPLRRLSAKIVDTSAMGNMAKTDAKEAVERLVKRLEYAVRIGGKKGGRMGGIWDEEVGGAAKRKRESLDGWVGAVKKEPLGEINTAKRGKEVKFDIPGELKQEEEELQMEEKAVVVDDARSDEQMAKEAKADDSFLREVTSEITGIVDG